VAFAWADAGTIIRLERNFARGGTSLKANDYTERPNEFGPKWMIGFHLARVARNIITTWFREGI
jgi:hypothetical protein